MPRRRKGAVRKGYGIMCNICGRNCGKGGGLATHLESKHGVAYDAYQRCFYDTPKTIIADAWDDSVKTSDGKTVITHVLVRRFVGDPGPRGASRSARHPR